MNIAQIENKLQQLIKSFKTSILVVIVQIIEAKERKHSMHLQTQKDVGESLLMMKSLQEIKQVLISLGLKINHLQTLIICQSQTNWQQILLKI